jgi:uncharacterized protein (TIGR03083 family)
VPLAPPPIVDTRSLFRPVSAGLVELLRRLTPDQWQRPTVAGAWRVRDVVAHVLDTSLRRLSFQRDGSPPPAPAEPIASERDLAAFINGLNATWVAAARRLSPRVLTDLYERAAGDAADFYESQPLDGPALFPVSWAGEEASASWFDIGREFTELWHHQQQVRLAVGDAGLPDPRYLHAVLAVSMRGLPHAYRGLPADRGDTIVIEVSGPSGGIWTLAREGDRWSLGQGAPAARETTRVRLDQDAAWRLLFNALEEPDAARAARISGRADLAAPLLRARSVIV